MMTIRQVLAGAVVVALSASVSLAQVRQIQMGGTMDANPGVGSGGSNRPVPGFVPVNGNDVMSGNVSGLSYFHGRVGTSSPYQFQGSLGTSSIGGFARQSAGSTNYSTYTGVAQPYFLPSATVSTAQGALYSAPIGSGFDSGLVPQSSYSPAASPAQLTAISSTTNGQAINRSIGVAPIEAGAPGAVLSNPLFVLRTTELPVKRMDLTHPTEPLAPGVSTQGPTAPNGSGLNANGPATEPATTNPTTAPANPNQIDAMVGGGKDGRVNAQTDELKDAMVSDTYLKLAVELKNARGNEPSAGGGPGNAATDNTLVNRSGIEIDPLTGKQRMISRLPSIPGTGRGPAGGTGTATQPGMVRAPELPAPSRLTSMSDAQLTAGSKIKPVHLAPGEATGSQVTAYDTMMVRAERNLKEGHFLDAAQSYQAALALKPDDPLALVGRAHAEMGAGIYAAADYDLKFVFTRKPEMVALRYDVDSFIPADRQAFLLEDFKKLTANKETAGMASFLYCYLCYQTGRTAELQAELKAWSGREAKDEWQVVAQRAWGAAGK